MKKTTNQNGLFDKFGNKSKTAEESLQRLQGFPIRHGFTKEYFGSMKIDLRMELALLTGRFVLKPVQDPEDQTSIGHFEIVPKEATTVFGSHEDEHGIQRCSNCNRKVAKRKVLFDKNMFKGGLKMREYAVTNNLKVVKMGKINLTKQEYGRVNYLVRFGLAYKNDSMGRGEYGIPRKRRHDFLNGGFKVARYYTDDPTLEEGNKLKREMSEERIGPSEIPSVAELRDATDGRFTVFSWNNDFE